jgi:hypothetical protein
MFPVVRKMRQFAAPPGYRRTPAPVFPTLAAYVKQRHATVRIRERLRDEDIGRIASTDEPRSLLSCRATTCLTTNYGSPAKGNDKGKVAGLVGHKTTSHFMVPLLVADDFYALNAQLLDGCSQTSTCRGCAVNPIPSTSAWSATGCVDALAGKAL